MPTKTKPKTTPAPLWTSPLKTADGRLLPSNGGKVVRWIESYCLHGEGDWFGQPVRLRDWQKSFLWRLYEFWPETKARRYKKAVLGTPKGNGKTPLAAWVGAYELAGGRSISPRVIIGAASLKQANLVFGDLKAAMTGPDDSPSPLADYVEDYDLQVLLKDRPGLAERIAAEAGTNDGSRATCFIADEVHEWDGRTKRVFLVVEGAVAKRANAFVLGISTAGVRGKDSPLPDLYDIGKKLHSGELEDDSFLFEWYEAPEDLTDLDDPEVWMEAVMAANPAAGDFNSLDWIRSRFDGALRLPRFEFERYHLNRWTASVNSWIPMERWDENGGEAEFSDNDAVWVAIAGASKRNSTAVWMARADDDTFPVQGQVFEPSVEGDVVDHEPIKAYIRELGRKYDVRQVRYTPLFWTLASELEEEGFPMWEVVQSVPRKASYSQALYDAVMERKLRHGGDATLRAHAQAAVAEDKGDGWVLQALKGSQPIGAVVATAMAVEAARDGAGAKKPGRLVTF